MGNKRNVFPNWPNKLWDKAASQSQIVTVWSGNGHICELVTQLKKTMPFTGLGKKWHVCKILAFLYRYGTVTFRESGWRHIARQIPFPTALAANFHETKHFHICGVTKQITVSSKTSERHTWQENALKKQYGYSSSEKKLRKDLLAWLQLLETYVVPVFGLSDLHVVTFLPLSVLTRLWQKLSDNCCHVPHCNHECCAVLKNIIKTKE